MLRRILALARKELLIFIKDPGGLVLVFLMPMMFILIMSYALAGSFGAGAENPIRILVVDNDEGRFSRGVMEELGREGVFELEREWKGESLTRDLAESLIAEGKRSLAIVFPPGFSDVISRLETAHGETVTVALIVDPATSSRFMEPIRGTIRGIIEKIGMGSALPKLKDNIARALEGRLGQAQVEGLLKDGGEMPKNGITRGENPLVSLEQMPPKGMGVEQYPDTFQQNVPGYTIFGLFWIVNLLATSVLEEKRSGTFRRLFVSPLGRFEILAGKMLPYYAVNLVQIAIMLFFARVFFGMSLGSSPLGIVAVGLSASASATGLGILVASVVRTDAQAGSLTVLVLLTLSALGGCFVPRFVMPESLQLAGLVTPHAWALDAFQDLLVRNMGFIDVLPKVLVLFAFGLGFLIFGTWRFRFYQH